MGPVRELVAQRGALKTRSGGSLGNRHWGTTLLWKKEKEKRAVCIPVLIPVCSDELETLPLKSLQVVPAPLRGRAGQDGSVFGAVFFSLKRSLAPGCLVWGPVEGDKPLSLIHAGFLLSKFLFLFLLHSYYLG